jgi:hypothetical protein
MSYLWSDADAMKRLANQFDLLISTTPTAYPVAVAIAFVITWLRSKRDKSSNAKRNYVMTNPLHFGGKVALVSGPVAFEEISARDWKDEVGRYRLVSAA